MFARHDRLIPISVGYRCAGRGSWRAASRDRLLIPRDIYEGGKREHRTFGIPQIWVRKAEKYRSNDETAQPAQQTEADFTPARSLRPNRVDFGGHQKNSLCNTIKAWLTDMARNHSEV